jgi:co-chaperonin GroES (HSP10)
MAVEKNPFDQKIGYKFRNKIKGIMPLHDHVIVTDMSFKGRTLSSGIMLLADDGKSEGIRPRWAKVYAVGPEQKSVTPGQWILVEHGRWSRGVEVEINDEDLTLRRVDPECMIFVSDTEPEDDDTISTALDGERKTRTNWAEE